MIATITNHISKGVQNFNDTSKKMTWFKTNFNMPVEDYMADNNPFTRYVGCWNYLTETTSYSLTGFVPGYEICVGHAIYDFHNNSGSTYEINTLLSGRWTDPSLNTLYWIWEDVPYALSLPAWHYSTVWYCGNIGCAGWEVSANGVYHFRAGAIGTPNIASIDSAVTMSNVPSTTQLGASKPGHIWVEGNNLCFINANQWKHTMIGTDNGDKSADGGYIWIDTSNVLHWIGGNGHDYSAKWQVKQFNSFYGNGPTGEVNAGTSKKGMMWTDNEFGWTHLSYIGYDGYKYLTGAGNNPYV